MAGYELSHVHKHRDPGDAVKLEHHNDKSPGFLRLKVSRVHLKGAYFTVPEPGHENDGEKRDDSFTLDLSTHRLS